MNWNWDHIRFFLALAEEGNLSRAARLLNVSHTTVLRRIRSFENQLESQLFSHTHAGYCLTESGQTLFNEARKMRGTLRELSREISGADNQLSGEVVITTTDTLARHVLPKILAKLSDKYVDLRFSLHMVNRLEDISNREADIAIRTCKTPPENLIGRKVSEIGFSCVASRSYIKKHKLAGFPKHVSKHRFIMLNDSYSAAPFYQWLEKKSKASTNVVRVNNFLCAAALAREGMGITVLPSYMLAKETTLQSLKTRDQISRNDLWVLSHVDLRATEKVRVVRQYLYDALPELIAA
jgi:DNA-binding transcriptional LysR family regulator